MDAMYATVIRPCPSKQLFMLSVFETPGGPSPWQSVREFSLGFPSGSPFTFKEAFLLTREEVDGLLDVDADKLAEGASDGKRLDPFTRQRLVRCARLFALALHVLGDRRAATRWLKSPQPELGSAVPLRLAQTEVGARTAERALASLERGTIATIPA
jgi:putative toxin-antitoxin system antitoxin component (TIGR02293 family)